MEEKIISTLKTIGYDGNLLNKETLKTSIEYGVKNIDYTKLVNFLTNEIRPLLSIDEEVNPIQSAEDAVAFVMEVTSFLKEMGCPYKKLVQGHVSDRLQTLDERILLINYLITELMSARIIQHKKPDKKILLKVQESPTASDLKKVLITLGFPKPPPNFNLTMMFNKLFPTVDQLASSNSGKELIGNPMFNGFLSEKQWETIGEIQKELYNEYKIRREMLLTRLDVTIQSFQWSNKTQGKDDFFEKIYKDKRKLLRSEPDVDIANLLSARDDVAIIEKTSSATVRKNTGTSIQKVIIGQVPDRGGRTNELAPPPPEMPSWQQRSGPPASARGRGGYQRGGQQFSRGGNQNYSRGGGQQTYSDGGSQHNYSGGGNQQNYSRDGHQNYSRGNNYRGSNNRSGYSDNSTESLKRPYSSLNSNLNSSNKKPFDSAGSYSSKLDFKTSNYLPFSNFETKLGLSSKSNFGSSSNLSSSSSSYSYSTNKYASQKNNSSGYSNNKDSYSKPFDSAGSYGSSNYYNTNQSGSGYNQKRTFDISDYGNQGNYDSGYGGYNQSPNSGYDNQQDHKKARSYDDFKNTRTTYSDEYVRDAQSNEQYRSGSARGRSNYHRGRGGGGYNRR